MKLIDKALLEVKTLTIENSDIILQEQLREKMMHIDVEASRWVMHG